MEDKIYDIVTDLLRDDITKDKAIEELLVLCDVSQQRELLIELLDWLSYGKDENGEWIVDNFLKNRLN